MEVKLEVKMTQRVMYDFLMSHTYKSISGIMGILFGVIALVIFVVTLGKTENWMSIVYLVFGIWFLLYMPVALYLRSIKQVKLNPTFKKMLSYVINEEGILTVQGDKQAMIKWDDILKIGQSKLSYLVYTGKRYSFVLPKEVIAEQDETLMKLFREHLPTEKIKIK